MTLPLKVNLMPRLCSKVVVKELLKYSTFIAGTSLIFYSFRAGYVYDLTDNYLEKKRLGHFERYLRFKINIIISLHRPLAISGSLCYISVV